MKNVWVEVYMSDSGEEIIEFWDDGTDAARNDGGHPITSVREYLPGWWEAFRHVNAVDTVDIGISANRAQMIGVALLEAIGR